MLVLEQLVITINCSFNTEGIGTYRGNENSNPVIGEKGKFHAENETFISVIFEKHKEKNILKALFDAHPYEEVAYDIVSLRKYKSRNWYWNGW